MTAEQGRIDLRRALEISRELAALAGHGDVEQLQERDALRMSLLESARRAMPAPDAEASAMLQEIATLNSRSIGLLEHRRHGKARELDTVAAGRRALRAYSTTSPGR